jgi:hypothetical protein
MTNENTLLDQLEFASGLMAMGHSFAAFVKSDLILLDAYVEFMENNSDDKIEAIHQTREEIINSIDSCEQGFLALGRRAENHLDLLNLRRTFNPSRRSKN